MKSKHLIKFFIYFVKKMKRRFEMIQYNNFTIAEYFRKQGAVIGEGCVIMPRSFGAEPYLIKIGNHVNINEGVTFLTHDGGTWIFREEIPDLRMFGPIVIEDNCLIGMKSIILPNVTIGKNSIVAANSVVISDVPENSIVMGVPARRFGSTKKYKEKCIEHWELQRPPDFPFRKVQNWDDSESQREIIAAVKPHLLEIFKDKLKK